MYKDKRIQNVKNFFVNVWRKNIFDIYVTEYGTALTTILPILFLETNKDRKITQVTTFNKMKNKQYQTVKIVS
jgi:hypothetical protein